MTSGQLILLRHGQTTYNEQMLMCGQHDAPLTRLGEEQAVTAGQRLAGMSFDKVYASSLSRAFNTAALALTEAGIAAAIEKRADLMEMNAGDFTGRSLSDPEIVAFPRSHDLALPNGETERQFVGRVRKFYDDEILPRMARGETVLVVSHAGVMHALDAVLNAPPGEERSIWDMGKKLPNTAIVIVDYEDGKVAGERLLEEKAAVAPRKKSGPRI